MNGTHAHTTCDISTVVLVVAMAVILVTAIYATIKMSTLTLT